MFSVTFAWLAYLLDCGVPVKFSLPLAGSTRMVTFLGLGVLVFLVTSPVSGTIGTTSMVFGGTSMYGWEAVVTGMFARTVVVLVID